MQSPIIRTIRDFSIEEIAESGQAFRVVRANGGAWRVIASGRLLYLKDIGEERYELSCSDEEFDSFWRAYFDLDTDYELYRKAALPDDEYLQRAISCGRGIRMLRQEPWEMLISFIISQRKSVPAIRTSVERLSERFGKRLASNQNLACAAGKEDSALNSACAGAKFDSKLNSDCAGAKFDLSCRSSEACYAFPEPKALAEADTKELAACGLGYRVDYVRNAARLVADGIVDLRVLAELDTAELLEALMQLKGVGIKVASCVALFGYHRLDTLPVDVWMKRVIETVYNGELPEEYRQYAGVLQQYMFNYARLNKVGA